jgi:hypothetical protein
LKLLTHGQWIPTRGIDIGESGLVCYNHTDNQSPVAERIVHPAVEIAYVQTLSSTNPGTCQGATICLKKSPIV